MKAYAIELLFDSKFDDYVRSLWNKCSKNGEISYMDSIEGIEPHIALAVYSGETITGIEDKFKDLQRYQIRPINLFFDALAVFKATNVIHISPNNSIQLMELMTLLHQELETYEEHCNPYYKLDRWNPHVTLSKCSSTKETLETFKTLLDSFEVIEAVADRLALIEIYYDSNGECVGSHEINTIDL